MAQVSTLQLPQTMRALDGQKWSGVAKARSRRVAIDLVAFADVICVLIGGILSAWILAKANQLPVHGLATVQGCLVTALFAYLCMRHFGLYDTRRMSDLPLGLERIAAAVLIALVAALGMGLPHGLDHSDVWVRYGTWFTTSLILITTVRCIARHVLAAMANQGLFNTRVAVYGAGRTAERIGHHLNSPEQGIRFAGIFDDRNAGSRAGVVEAQTPLFPSCESSDLKWPDLSRHGACAGPRSRPHRASTDDGSLISLGGITGTLDDLIAAGRAGEIDRIIIALPQTADRRISDVARKLEQLPSSLHVVTHIASDLVDENPAHAVSSLGPIGLLDIKTQPLSDWAPHVKTVEDYVIGLVALILAAPVMALVALAVRFDSPGPVLFRQRRHGLNRRVIGVLKFRTMRVLENGADIQQATAGDVRITRLGRFLRSTSLDELPQLINVLKGEMSLVGPRPHALVHDDHYGEMLERYANRHQVKPGMTGLAQVEGFRGPTDTPDKMQSRVEHDLIYIDTWSLWLDLKILGLTVVRGFKHRNAL